MKIQVALAVAILSPWPMAAAAGETALTAKTAFADVGGTQIAYRSLGDGDPIVLLQRYRASMDDWDPAFIDALASARRVILVDPPGIGESTGTPDASLEDTADFLADFHDALDLERPDVLGWSMGGMTAQIFAIEHKQSLDQLILLGTLPPGGSPEIVVTSGKWGETAAKPAYSEDDLAFLFFSLSENGKAAALASNARISQRSPATHNKITVEAAAAQYQSIGAFFQNSGGWYQRLGEIMAETLVVNGDRDGAFPAIDSAILAREIPNSQLMIYADGGHGVQMQYPERVAADIIRFLGN